MAEAGASATPILSVRDLTMHFPIHKGSCAAAWAR
jgi:hypothetical protein